MEYKITQEIFTRYYSFHILVYSNISQCACNRKSMSKYHSSYNDKNTIFW